MDRLEPARVAGRGDDALTRSRIRVRVLVVGAGPAGSALAGLLATGGLQVLIVDRARFPRAKACGECVNPGGVRALQRLGLLSTVLETRPVALRGWTLHTLEGRRACGSFPPGHFGLGVDRTSFDRVLLEAAIAKGATVLEGVRIEEVDVGGPDRPAVAWGRVRGGERRAFEADLLIGADGLRSVVARRSRAVGDPGPLRKASLSWRVQGVAAPRDRGHLLLGGDLTVGLAPVASEEGRTDLWNGTLVVDPARYGEQISNNAWSLFRMGLALMGTEWESGPRAVGGPWASGPFDWPCRNSTMGRTLLVGDAAGYYDPLTGQGIYRALRSAELAERAVRGALPSGIGDVGHEGEGGGALPLRAGPLAGYEGRMRRAFGPGRALQRVIEGVVSRPGLRELALGAMSWSPRAASTLIGLTGNLELRGGD